MSEKKLETVALKRHQTCHKASKISRNFTRAFNFHMNNPYFKLCRTFEGLGLAPQHPYGCSLASCRALRSFTLTLAAHSPSLPGRASTGWK